MDCTISPLYQPILDAPSKEYTFGDPCAFYFELFLPWVYKLMRIYDVEEKKDLPKTIPSRSNAQYSKKIVN